MSSAEGIHECAWCEEPFERYTNPKYTTARIANKEHGGEGWICVKCYAHDKGWDTRFEDGVVFFVKGGAQ